MVIGGHLRTRRDIWSVEEMESRAATIRIDYHGAGIPSAELRVTAMCPRCSASCCARWCSTHSGVTAYCGRMRGRRKSSRVMVPNAAGSSARAASRRSKCEASGTPCTTVRRPCAPRIRHMRTRIHETPPYHLPANPASVPSPFERVVHTCVARHRRRYTFIDSLPMHRTRRIARIRSIDITPRFLYHRCRKRP